MHMAYMPTKHKGYGQKGRVSSDYERPNYGGKKLIHKGKGTSNMKVVKTDRIEFFSAKILRKESQLIRKPNFKRE